MKNISECTSKLVVDYNDLLLSMKLLDFVIYLRNLKSQTKLVSNNFNAKASLHSNL